MSKLCSCIVPCFNEEEVIPLYYEEMQKVRKQEEGKIDFEIIFIDDGSKDKTLEVIKKLSEQDECIHYVSFSRNFGKEAAMYAGNARVNIIRCTPFRLSSCIREKYVLQHPYNSTL